MNEAVLRSQAKAVYSIDNIGHFGLSLRNYAHFTSPIRRYADLLVHRALVDAAAGRKSGPKDGLNGMPLDQIAEICTHISETEANAAAAERRTIDRFAAALFEARLGAVVDGVIVAITGFGAFIRLEDGAADGLLPLNGFPDDFYDYDEAAQSLDGRHNGWRFVMGLSLRVKVTEVTPISGGILLEWVEGGLQSETSARKSAKYEKKHSANRSGRGARTKPANGRNTSGHGKGSKRKRR